MGRDLLRGDEQAVCRYTGASPRVRQYGTDLNVMTESDQVVGEHLTQRGWAIHHVDMFHRPLLNILIAQTDQTVLLNSK